MLSNIISNDCKLMPCRWNKYDNLNETRGLDICIQEHRFYIEDNAQYMYGYSIVFLYEPIVIKYTIILEC